MVDHQVEQISHQRSRVGTVNVDDDRGCPVPVADAIKAALVRADALFHKDKLLERPSTSPHNPSADTPISVVA